MVSNFLIESNSAGTTPLHLACKNFDLEGIKLIFERADMVVLDCIDTEGNLPLHYLALKA